ncbi:winged helix-turn-helix domain-containing protein [Actinacidiphila reveromycinica]|uniref:winged helix-turn-helix domain-containing protein n=1 Tax=Actinacidiphila reveromycinica TaxID=659352 RepID=UPI0019222C8A|nr:winged helix-turn-helix domain-containing protein [Streptomyces sp. SN-593]
MGRPSPVRRGTAVNRDTGEITQLEFFERPKTGIRYDWRPNPGRHVNVPKELVKRLYDKSSGYNAGDRDVFFFYLGFSPDGTEPLRMTFKEIADVIGGRPDTIAKRVGKLNRGGLLLEAERVGRIVFYRANPRSGFDGAAEDQVQAVKDVRFPVIPAPANAEVKRKAAS